MALYIVLNGIELNWKLKKHTEEVISRKEEILGGLFLCVYAFYCDNEMFDVTFATALEALEETFGVREQYSTPFI